MKKICYSLFFLMASAAPVLASESVFTGMDMTERMMLLAVQTGLILFAAKICGKLVERIGQPAVLGEVVAGMLIGPYLLGGISLPGFPHGIFPPAGEFPVSPELYGICAIASIVLLFTVGLETDMGLLIRYSVAGIVVGLGGVVISFLVGDFTAVLFSRMVFGKPLSFSSPQCLFLGIISTATSVGITARILSEKRKLDSPEGVTILAGAVIDDVLGIICLAVVLGIVSASRHGGAIDWGVIGTIAAKAVGIWLGVTAIGLAVSRRIGFLLKLFGDHSTIALAALGLALGLAGMFEHAGLAMIVGAYVTGLSLSKTDIAHLIREKLAPVYSFLVPVFFCVMGMLTDFHSFMSKPVLIFGAIYTVTAVLAKIVGCGLPTMLCGFNIRGAMRIGCGMIPRGEIALIIAGIGLAKGMISQKTIGVSVLLTIATTLIAPPILVRLFKNPAPGTRKPVKDSGEKQITFSFPSPEFIPLLVSNIVSALRTEGFFIHLLDSSQQIHEARKDAMVVNFRVAGTSIIFGAQESEIPLINTAILEVEANIEKTLRGLRAPIRPEDIAGQMQKVSRGTAHNLKVADFLVDGALVPRMHATTKKEAIDELLGVLVREDMVHDAATAGNDIWARENVMSTGMQHGIAIPHGRTDAVDRLVCAVGIKPEGIDFDSLDKQPCRIIILTLSPKKGHAPQMQFMSAMSLVMDETGRKLLLACETPQEMLTIIAGANGHALRRELVRRTRGRTALKLSDHIKRDLIIARLKASNSTQAIDEFLELLKASGRLENIDLARRDVLAREAQMPTGLEQQIAIPHAKTDAVRELVCAIGIKPDGIHFGAESGILSKVVIFTLAPRKTTAPQALVIALIAREVESAGIERILACGSTEQIYDILAG